MPTLAPQTTPFYGGGQVLNPANVKKTSGAPSSKLTEDHLGTLAIDNANANAYMLVSKSGGVDTWNIVAGASAGLTSLTGDAGTATASGGTVTVSGGTTGLTTSGTSHTLSLTGTLVVANGGTGAATLTSHGVLVGAGTSAVAGLTAGTNGQVLLGSTGANPAFGTLTTSTGVAYTTGAGSLAINVKSGGFAVTPVAGTSQALASQTSFIANSASLTTFTLPASSSVGDIINVVGSALNTGGWKITYGSGQIIWGPAGSSTITTGNAATGAAAAQTASLMCVVANTTWVIYANSGTITLT
jgi:hypothetical protein